MRTITLNNRVIRGSSSREWCIRFYNRTIIRDINGN